MTAAVCTDKGKGIMFGGKRQSRDSAVYERIIEKVNSRSSTLFLSPYSEPLFSEVPGYMDLKKNGRINVSPDFPDKASGNDICFFEDILPGKYSSKIDQLIIYNWNRKYPSDKKIDLDMKRFKKISETEFKGSSHDKITEQIYVLKNRKD